LKSVACCYTFSIEYIYNKINEVKNNHLIFIKKIKCSHYEKRYGYKLCSEFFDNIKKYSIRDKDLHFQYCAICIQNKKEIVETCCENKYQICKNCLDKI
jgi:hypothetical protein